MFITTFYSSGDLGLKTILAVFVLAYVTLFLSGYGILIGSHTTVAGLGLKCKYLTARSIVAADYLHSSNGVIGVAECPIFKKVSDIVG